MLDNNKELIERCAAIRSKLDPLNENLQRVTVSKKDERLMRSRRGLLEKYILNPEYGPYPLESIAAFVVDIRCFLGHTLLTSEDGHTLRSLLDDIYDIAAAGIPDDDPYWREWLTKHARGTGDNNAGVVRKKASVRVKDMAKPDTPDWKQKTDAVIDVNKHIEEKGMKVTPETDPSDMALSLDIYIAWYLKNNDPDHYTPEHVNAVFMACSVFDKLYGVDGQHWIKYPHPADCGWYEKKALRTAANAMNMAEGKTGKTNNKGAHDPSYQDTLQLDP